jgi:DNA-binding MurR/RpiR family transcriptional regulator
MPQPGRRLTKPTNAASPQSRLLGVFGSHHLSPSHRRIARELVDGAPESVFLSSIELAARAGVSQPTVTRFARALDFDGYTELQSHLRSLMVDPHGRSGAAPGNVYQRAVRESVHGLEALDALLEQPDTVVELGRELARTDPLVVLSVRASAPAASYFAYYAARVHPDVRLLAAGGSAILDGLAQAHHSGARWLLCFLLSRQSVEVLTGLRYARDLGYRVAVITDQASDMVRDLSDVVLPVAIGSGLVFNTYAAPMVLAGALLHAMCEAEPRRTRERLDRHEHMVATQRVFHPAGRGSAG